MRARVHVWVRLHVCERVLARKLSIVPLVVIDRFPPPPPPPPRWRDAFLGAERERDARGSRPSSRGVGQGGSRLLSNAGDQRVDAVGRLSRVARRMRETR